jgi:hypothetical protein
MVMVEANMRSASAVPAAVRVLPLTERMVVVTELTGALELATRSGQQHLMNKVVTILRREVEDAQGPAAGSDRASVWNAMADLEHEAGRISPLPNAFNRHAQVVIGALLRSPTG